MIYLVLNTEDLEEPYVLYICKDEKTAEMKVDEVKENFIENAGYSSKDEIDFIDYVTLDTTVNTPILWSAYDNSEDSI